tara:strand:- start:8009 stop:8956 length:948 start_codon:yes stop_codon:yes gene_type:complete
MYKKAAILGIGGTKLSNDERTLIRNKKPWGIILFSRNIKDIKQLKNLIDSIKYCAQDKKYPIIIDQEGGKVSRLNKIVDLSIFSQKYFGQLYIKDKNNFENYYKIYINNVCKILNEVGININTVPVLDVIRTNTHNIIGDRSFSSNAKVVSQLGQLCIKLYEKNKIATVIKHIPGHGLSKVDTHLDLPIIYNKKKELIKNDFKPFKQCKSLFAMTAHIIYSDYDSKFAATQSKIIINKIIRKHISFKGILISDDISMKSLKYGLVDNSRKALDAGCNLILHCNGNIKEMFKLLEIVPTIDKFTQKKTSDFYKFLG